MKGQRLQVAFLWHKQVLGYRLLEPKESVTVGPAKGVTFVTPRLEGFPRRFRLLRPIKDGFRLRLGPGMTGQLLLRGQERTVGDVLTQPAVRRFLRDPGMFRETELYPGDTASVDLDTEGNLRLQISFADPPGRVGKPRRTEPLYFRTTVGTAVGTLALLALILFFGDRVPDTLEITPERYANIVAPVLEAPQVREDQQKQKAAVAERERKRKEKEAAESKRMKEKEGRLGRADAQHKETVIPKGREDILRAKVAKTGILSVLGSARAQGSGLSQLFARTDGTQMEQAINGLSANQLIAGKGNQGLGTAGSGLGGGGTGFGRIQGSGDLNVGAGRGHGRKGPGLGLGREKEVAVGVETGTPDAEGGLTKDQINRVVNAHKAAVRYCYEKELQRQPSLSGKIEVFWTIRSNGTVDRTKIVSSSMGSHAVEGCLERQVKNWQFPKSDADTIVQVYPFLFKGGA
jgi:outer membrane biosynthesis protein TonB